MSVPGPSGSDDADSHTDTEHRADEPSTEEAPSVLLSRVAENAYWVGRYLERAEATARLVKARVERGSQRSRRLVASGFRRPRKRARPLC